MEMICYCSNVPKDEIVKAIENGAKTLDEIRQSTGACTVGRCAELSPRKKCCSPEIMKVIKEQREALIKSALPLPEFN